MNTTAPNRHWPLRTPGASRICALALVCFVFLAGCTTQGSDKPEVVPAHNGPIDRGTAHVHVSETIDDETPDSNITKELLERELVLHGFRIVDRPSDARWVVTGAFTGTFYKDVIFEFAGQKQLLEKQYHGEAYVDIVDTSKPEGADGRVERCVIEQIRNGRTDDRLARRDIRRLVATNLGRKMMRTEMLGHPEVVPLLDALQSSTDARTFNQIVDELVAVGTPAVPYLLDLMDTHDTMLLPGRYPDMTEENVGSLTVYHVADLALGEILQAYSGLGLDSEEEDRLKVNVAWTWAWEDLQGIPDAYRLLSEQRATTVKAMTREEKAAMDMEEQ